MHRQSILDPCTGLSAWKSHPRLSQGEPSLLADRARSGRACLQRGRLSPGGPSWERRALLHTAQGEQGSPRHRKIPSKSAKAKLAGRCPGSAARVRAAPGRAAAPRAPRAPRRRPPGRPALPGRGEHRPARSALGADPLPGRTRELSAPVPPWLPSPFLPTTLSKHSTKNSPAHQSQGRGAAARTGAVGNKKQFSHEPDSRASK